MTSAGGCAFRQRGEAAQIGEHQRRLDRLADHPAQRRRQRLRRAAAAEIGLQRRRQRCARGNGGERRGGETRDKPQFLRRAPAPNAAGTDPGEPRSIRLRRRRPLRAAGPARDRKASAARLRWASPSAARGRPARTPALRWFRRDRRARARRGERSADARPRARARRPAIGTPWAFQPGAEFAQEPIRAVEASGFVDQPGRASRRIAQKRSLTLTRPEARPLSSRERARRRRG